MKNDFDSSTHIMLVDDNPVNLKTLEILLRKGGVENTITCEDSRRVMKVISSNSIEVVVLDLMMPHITGEEILSEISRKYPDIPVIIVTGKTEIDSAVQCMKFGAFDYLVKPVDRDRLLTSVRRARQFRELKLENRELKERIGCDLLQYPDAFSEIITQNQKMISLFKHVEHVARTSQPLLITGETGVGKELMARSAHKVSGVRGKLVAVNVAGLEDDLFSDTLFGHVKGAFTGAETVRNGLIEQAEGGTLFLDEIGDLSSASQVKLLRLLQEGEYFPLGRDDVKKTDARIVLSTNKDLWALQREGKFRPDLNFRLRTHHIHIPPLRERKEDIPLLVEVFLERASEVLNKKKPTAPKELFSLLEAYHFPGNVRELFAMVFDAVSRHERGILSLEVFTSQIFERHSAEGAGMETGEGGTHRIFFPRELPTIKEITEMLISEALRRADDNQSIAARMLGISQPALSKRLKKNKRQSRSSSFPVEPL